MSDSVPAEDAPRPTKSSTTPSTTASPRPSGAAPPAPDKPPREVGGPKGPEPTRYGDWEVGGRCTDF